MKHVILKLLLIFQYSAYGGFELENIKIFDEAKSDNYRITAWNTLGRSDRVELNLRGAATTKGSYYQLMDSVVHGIVMASLVSDYFIANPYDIFIIALIAIVILLFRLKKGKTSKIGNLENICCYEFVYHVCNSMFTKHVIGIFISMSI